MGGGGGGQGMEHLMDAFPRLVREGTRCLALLEAMSTVFKITCPVRPERLASQRHGHKRPRNHRPRYELSSRCL